MVKVLIKKLDPSVKLPEYKTSGASGLDLMAFIKEPIEIKPKTSSLIPTATYCTGTKAAEAHSLALDCLYLRYELILS